jgi:hypothetical protein
MAQGLANLPLLIRCHVAIAFTAVAFGSLAILLRIPDVLVQTLLASSYIRSKYESITDRLLLPLQKLNTWGKRWHGTVGMLYLAFCLFIPITSNWIWPRLGTPHMVIWFITTMHVAIILGMASIRLYRFLNEGHYAQVPLMQQKGIHQGNYGTHQTPDSNHHGEENENGRHKKKEEEEDLKLSTPRYLWLKYLHGFFMIYSFVMLVGAGQAFSSNARVGGFPYPPEDPITDSLIGRCYGRDLSNDPSAPSWLTELACGLGVYCAESSRGA